jgi:hypothetical protein
MGIELSMNDIASRFSELPIQPTRQTSVRATFEGSDSSKENRRTLICKAWKKFSGHFKNCGIPSLLRSFKWYLNKATIGCAASLNMTERTFVNDIFPNRVFHGQKYGRILSFLFGRPGVAILHTVPNVDMPFCCTHFVSKRNVRPALDRGSYGCNDRISRRADSRYRSGRHGMKEHLNEGCDDGRFPIWNFMMERQAMSFNATAIGHP